MKNKSKTEAAPVQAGDKRKYNQAYAAAQAGGMNETDSHEFALDHATGVCPTRPTHARCVRRAKQNRIERLISARGQ